MRYGLLAAGILFVIFIEIATPGGETQNGTEMSLFLVARRELSNPLFKESVVLMLPSADTDVVVGLIVNKPTRIQLREVFPKDSALKNRSDAVYFGGPVDTEAPSALFLSSKPSKQAVHLVGDLYVSFDSDFIEGMLKKPKQARDVRLFLGRAQWAPDQLQDETLRGAWYRERAENSWIFSREPENVWHSLIGRAEPGMVARLDARNFIPAKTIDETLEALGTVPALQRIAETRHKTG
jgi:putative transcriptional regulator